MATRQTVLVVAESKHLLTTLVSWVESGGYRVLARKCFKDARAVLEAANLLVTELKLGEYNGLHLALRAQNAGVPSIVIGPDDPVLSRDAAELGAIYITQTVHQRQLLDAVAEAMTVVHVPPFVWPDAVRRALARRQLA